MPPKTKPPSIPKGMGRDALEFLEHHGFMARTPAIRSSDYESSLRCPFQYYLSRRLGLTPCLRWSEALSRGSWFHKRAEYWKDTQVVAETKMKYALEEREEELKEICEARGIIGGSRESILLREKKDMQTATAWFEAASKFIIKEENGIKKSFIEVLERPWWRELCLECVLQYDHPEYGTLITQPDILLYHKTQNKIWIVDFKTCAESPSTRLQTCPIEFQTQHYMFVAHYLIQEGTLQKHFDLPEDVEVGGMMHIAVQKPSIQFGSKDKDFDEKHHTLSRGPRKGQVEMRRTYHGEPKFSNYLKRIKDWYNSEGEYEHLAPERILDPPVNISSTYFTPLDTTFAMQYHSRLCHIRRYATVDPAPGNFPLSVKNVSQHGKLSPFAPFYLSPVVDWPNIVQQEGFLFEDRDRVESEF